jgi:hypothetical protein
VVISSPFGTTCDGESSILTQKTSTILSVHAPEQELQIKRIVGGKNQHMTFISNSNSAIIKN